MRRFYASGAYFAVPLKDCTFGIGQIISVETKALNSVVCAFFKTRLEGDSGNCTPMFTESDLISILFVTPDLLNSGSWKVLSRGKLIPIRNYMDLSDLRSRGFVGVDIIGSANVVRFLEAYHGLYPWDAFHRPDYFDHLLLSSDKKPANLMFRSRSKNNY